MKYVLVYMPEPFNKDSLRFFETEEEAWGYVKDNILCNYCIESLERGCYYKIDGVIGGELADRIECNHPSQTACGSEWEVMKAKDYFDCKGNLKKLFQKCWGDPVKEERK